MADHAYATDAGRPSTSGRDAAASSQEASPSGISWRTHTNPAFSIRPSFLSPLHSTYARQRDLAERRTLLKYCIMAHAQLASEIEAADDEQAVRHARKRASQLRELIDDLFEIRKPENLPACTSPDAMYGWYALLEHLARTSDATHEPFHAVQSGRADIFDYWARNFVQLYKDTPSLEPLEAVYARPDPRDVLAALQLKVAAQAAATTEAALQAPTTRVDVAGASHAKGSKKTSRARVRLSPGVGRVTVNTKPYDLYFPDLRSRFLLLQPFFVTKTICRYDVEAEVHGGGMIGQAGAVGMAVARALAAQNPLLARPLAALIKSDTRQKERSKIGRYGARAGRPWVKR